MKIKQLSLLILAVTVYSASSFFTKQGAGNSFLSNQYLLCLLGLVTVLGLYAVLWQVALKRIPLSQAYPFRSLSIVFGLAIAYFAFHEEVTWQNIVGATIIIFGLIIITTGK